MTTATTPETVTVNTVAFEATTDLPFSEAVQRARQELDKEGFGVLTEIDVAATLKKKLDVDRTPFLILGACHAPSAHRALQAAPEAGVMLPCNVTVSVENDRTVVRAMNPEAAMGLIGKPEIAGIADEVGGALRRVVAAVAG